MISNSIHDVALHGCAKHDRQSNSNSTFQKSRKEFRLSENRGVGIFIPTSLYFSLCIYKTSSLSFPKLEARTTSPHHTSVCVSVDYLSFLDSLSLPLICFATYIPTLVAIG